MSLTNAVVVIPGVTGVVASGAARAFLDAGATVVGISRDAGKIELFRKAMKVSTKEPFISVVGDFSSEATAESTKTSVLKALGGRAVDHVVSGVGFITVGPGPTAAPLSLVRKALDDGLFTNVLVGRAFLPLLKGRTGASFTMVSGGLAHGLPEGIPNAEQMWMATIKNASVNALTHGFSAEMRPHGVRVNTVCIHFGVAAVGATKNQLGMPADHDTLKLAPAFVALAKGTRRGEVLCLNGWADVAKA